MGNTVSDRTLVAMVADGGDVMAHIVQQVRGPAEKILFRSRFSGNAHVRFGSKADMCSAKQHVRFTPKADIRRTNCHVCFVPKADIRTNWLYWDALKEKSGPPQGKLKSISKIVGRPAAINQAALGHSNRLADRKRHHRRTPLLGEHWPSVATVADSDGRPVQCFSARLA